MQNNINAKILNMFGTELLIDEENAWIYKHPIKINYIILKKSDL